MIRPFFASHEAGCRLAAAEFSLIIRGVSAGGRRDARSFTHLPARGDTKSLVWI